MAQIFSEFTGKKLKGPEGEYTGGNFTLNLLRPLGRL
jgi:hypothetical protein